MPWPWPRCSGNCYHSVSQEQKLVPEPAAPEVPHLCAGETFLCQLPREKKQAGGRRVGASARVVMDSPDPSWTSLQPR